MSMRSARERLRRLENHDLEALRGRSLLQTRQGSRAELESLCDLAEAFQALDRAGVACDLFPRQMFLALFFDASTRTRSSWAGAAARLGAQPVVLDGSATQVGHGETAAETGAMLGMNAHALGIRHDLILGEGERFIAEARRGIGDYLAATADPRIVPMVNLQCDVDHPTQTLADLCWLRERFPDGLEGRTMAVSWAYSPSYAKPLSVPQGLITLLTRFGMNVRLAHPPGYDLMPDCLDSAADFAARAGGSFEIIEDMDRAFAEADVVYPKSWGPFDLMQERVAAHAAADEEAMADIERRSLERNQRHRDWICDARRMDLTAGGKAMYMHCLPADIGSEVEADVMADQALALARQANKKVYVIMALLAAAKSRDLARELMARWNAAGEGEGGGE